MVSLSSLWLPILLSAVAVFFMSAILHMVLRYHFNDFKQLQAEDEVMAAVGRFDLAPGEYVMPYCSSAAAMKDPAVLEKFTRGPVAFLSVRRSGPPTMGKELAMWFVFCLVVSLFAAYVASRTLDATAEYFSVFRLTSTVAFAGYALALWQETIWYNRSVSTTVKNSFDGLIYALLTAGLFGWLW